jgi:hypothetical protein
MVMVGDFSLYGDESYSHPPEPLVYTIGCYVSTHVQWKTFQKEWRRILDAENIEFFHMVDFQACKPPYGSWSKEKRASFLASLHAVIHKRTLMSFATTADIEDFENLTAEQKEALVNPHVFAAKNCMKAVGVWAARNIINYPLIAYIFEKGSPHDNKLKRLFTEEFTDEDRWFFRMASLAFVDKKIMSPLQAADIVAYESRKEIVRRLDVANPRPARLSGINLGKTNRDVWMYCEKYDFIKSIGDAELRAKDYASRSTTKRPCPSP